VDLITPIGIVSVTRSSKVIYLPRWKDEAGTVITCTNDRPPIKPYYTPEMILLVHGAFAVASGDGDTLCTDFANKVNSGGWRGWDVGEAWVYAISSEEETLNDVEVETFIVTIACRKGGWVLESPEIGHVYKSGGLIYGFKGEDELRYIGNLDAGGDDGGDTMLVTDWDVKESVSFGGLPF